MDEQRRRADWRGERRAVLVRLPVEVAEALQVDAVEAEHSVSEHAALLLARALEQGAA